MDLKSTPERTDIENNIVDIFRKLSEPVKHLQRLSYLLLNLNVNCWSFSLIYRARHWA